MKGKYPVLQEYQTIEIPIAVIHCDADFNCRGQIAPQSCLELADSIRDHGLKMPIMVQPASDVANIPSKFEYRIVAGHRRFTAARWLLRWTAIPAVIVTGLTDEDARLLNLMENLERKDLTFMEQARALRRSFPPKTSLRKIAQTVNKSHNWVRNRWLVHTLPDKVIKLIEQGVVKDRDLHYLYPRSTEEQIALAEELQSAKLKGVSGRTFARSKGLQVASKNRTTIREMLSRLMGEGRYPDPYRALLWAAGDLSDDELLNGPEV